MREKKSTLLRYVHKDYQTGNRKFLYEPKPSLLS